MSYPNLTEGLMWYFVFLYSTVCHEAGHAWSAWKLGDSTAYEGGQVSLDPIPHVKREPFGMVVIPILSYLLGGWMMGWASAPLDPEWVERNPRPSVWVSLAGPAANLVLLLASVLCIHLGLHFGVFEPPNVMSSTHVVDATRQGLWDLAAAVVSIVFSLNLLLFFFNLLPLPPLDGSNLPFLFLGHDAALTYRRFVWSPVVQILGLLLAFRGFRYVYPAIEGAVQNLIYPGIHYS